MTPPNKTVLIDFESHGLADLYLLESQEELNVFNTGRHDFVSCIRGTNQYTQTVKLDRLAPGATWYLVIANPTPARIAIYFRVFNAP